MGWEAVVIEKAIENLADHAIGMLYDNLKEINNKLDILIEKDLNVAIDYLHEYGRCQSPDRKEQILNKALECFRASYGVKDPWIRVNSSFGMCVCYIILCDRDELLFRSKQCIDDCQVMLVELINSAYAYSPYGNTVLNGLALEYGQEEFNKFKELADILVHQTAWRHYANWAVRFPGTRVGKKLKWLEESFHGPGLKQKRYLDWKIKYFTSKNIMDSLTASTT